MKKLLLNITFILSLLMLAGCTNKTNNKVEMYVNGTLVDDQLVSFERDGNSNVTNVLIPIVKLFQSIGYTVTWSDDYHARIERDGLCILLDVKTHRLDVDDEDDHWNRFTLMPGDTEEDFVVKESYHELLVCSDYVQSAFELLYIDMELSVDYNKGRVMIISDGVYHAPYWLEGKTD